MATSKKKAPTTGTAKTTTASKAGSAKTKTAAKPKATAETEPRPTEPATAKTPAKAPARSASKTSAKGAAQPAVKAPAKPAVKAPTKPATKEPAQAATKPENIMTPQGPAAPEPPKAAVKALTKPKKATKDSLTPEEKARVVKLRATLALLKADPEWPAFLEQQRQSLLRLRDELLPNMQNVTRDHLRSGASNVSSSSGQHIGDAGSEAEVRDLTIRLLDKDREQLFEIDAALERIRRGYYGICEISLDPIPRKRLQVRPFCRLTVKCQEEYEKKYGSYANYRARNNDRVGYAGLQNDMENAISLDDDDN